MRWYSCKAAKGPYQSTGTSEAVIVTVVTKIGRAALSTSNGSQQLRHANFRSARNQASRSVRLAGPPDCCRPEDTQALSQYKHEAGSNSTVAQSRPTIELLEQEAEPSHEAPQDHGQTSSRPLSAILQLVGAVLCFPALAGSLAVAFAVTSAVLMTHSADAREVPLDVYTVPFALATFVFAYDSIRDSSTMEATPVRREEILRRDWMYKVFMLGTLGFLIARLSSAQWQTTRIVLLIVGVNWMYTAKCIPVPQLRANSLAVRWSSLKGVPLMKNLAVPALWGFAASFLTEALLRENGVHEIDNGARNTMWLFSSLYDFSIIIIHNDCRDYFEDVKSGVSTIPTLFGIRSSLLFAEILLLCLYAASSLAFFSGHQISSDFLGVPFSLDVEAAGFTLGLIFFLPSDIIPMVDYSRSSFSKLSDEGQLRVERMSLVKLWQGAFILVIFLMFNAILKQS